MNDLRIPLLLISSPGASPGAAEPWAIPLLVLLLALSAFFSSAETAFLSAQRVRLRQMAIAGSKAAHQTEEMVERPGRLIATFLLGNNLVNTAFVALITVIVGSLVRPELAVPIATVTVTVLLLIFGEVTPKTVAFHHAERMALLYVYPMRLLIVLLSPIVMVLERLIPVPGRRRTSLGGEEEIRTMVATGAREGSIEEHEAELVENVFRFGDRQAREMVTPRPEIVWVEDDITLTGLLALYPTTPHTRFPVYRESQDDVVGVLSIKDVLRAWAQGSISDDSPVSDLARPALFVPETKAANSMFSEMRSANSQLALVVDEYGSIAGLVTMKRLVEEIVGEVGDELSLLEPAAPRGHGTFTLEGSASVDEANELLGLDLPLGDYQTVAGFVLSLLGHIPQEGERASFDGISLVVERMHGAKIERLLIVREG